MEAKDWISVGISTLTLVQNWCDLMKKQATNRAASTWSSY